MKNNFLTMIIVISTCAYFNSSAQTITLDYYFNHENRVNKAGQQERYHYTWEDTTTSGYFIFGEAFKKNGARLDTLGTAPTFNNLSSSDIYIIVDPDTKKESPHPNYIETKDITEIVKWVKAGGVLVMMANDSANVELPHFNNLAARFGMHFNDDLQNHVTGNNYQDGAIITSDNPVFKTAYKIYIKDACSFSLKYPAVSVLKNRKRAVIMAQAKYGKGSVFAVGDPWLYNEYTNGKLPPDFENSKAADNIAKWLIGQIPKKGK